MILKGIRDEDFCQYKDPSMFLIFPSCSFKCEKECGQACCQNSELSRGKELESFPEDIVRRYQSNPITSAVVCGGLEPFDSFIDLFEFIKCFRKYTDDTVVVYTGYNEDEVRGYTYVLSKFKNIIVKFGRFIPDSNTVFDEVLGVELASENQYAKKIS